jgi:nucleoside diphosphate kinase
MIIKFIIVWKKLMIVSINSFIFIITTQIKVSVFICVMDTNFHARYESKLNELEGDELVEYMIKCLPFINKYSGLDPTEKEKSLFGATRKGGIKKSDIFNEYLEQVENVRGSASQQPVSKYTHNTILQPCDACNSSNVFLDHVGWVEICQSCGVCRQHQGYEMSYKDEQEHPDRNVNYSYKRSNHFQEWLNQLQAEETTTIPPEVVDVLRIEFRKERTKAVDSITHAKVRSFLKKLRLNKYYEHVPYITNILSGIPPMKMPGTLQERLKNMFNEIQSPFDKHCPPDRKNFLSYSYVLYKFCELLSEDQYLIYFPLLKSRDKLASQDSIWRNICKELMWEFIPTV